MNSEIQLLQEINARLMTVMTEKKEYWLNLLKNGEATQADVWRASATYKGCGAMYNEFIKICEELGYKDSQIWELWWKNKSKANGA